MLNRNCYEAALNAFLTGGAQGIEGARLAHGFPALHKDDLDSPAGSVYGHAWIEGKINGVEVCLNLTPQILTNRLTFYMAGKINPDYVTHYTESEAFEKAVMTENSGPWTDEGDLRHAPGAAFVYLKPDPNGEN